MLTHIKKLKQYYELVVYTILPMELVTEIYKLIPTLSDHINHTLSYEHLTFCDETSKVIKDMSLLQLNRIELNCETIVLDSTLRDQCCDTNLVTFF